MKIPRVPSHYAVALAVVLTSVCAPSAEAETLTRSSKYFTIGGATPEEIEQQLTSLGPEIKGSSFRHPGATRLQFSNSVTYARNGRSCRVSTARVKIAAEVILPKWRRPANAEPTARIFWDVVSADISRHEESHLVIGRKYAREIERRLIKLRPASDCEEMAKAVKAVQDQILAKHDAEQQLFDRVEAKSIDKRLLAKLKRRLSGKR